MTVCLTPALAQTATPAADPEALAREAMQKLVEKQAREAELKAIEERLAGNADARANLEKEIAAIRADRAGLNKALLDATTKTQGAEQKLGELEKRLSLMQSSETAIRRSLERVRAAFGDDSVVTLTHGAGHLPEARLRFEPLDDVPPMPERIEGELQLIRRVELKPSPCPAPVEQGVSVMLNGGWWRGEVRREYRFVEEHGVIRWLYFDVLRGRWMRHGSVE